MTYGNWAINGIIPRWIVGSDWTSYPKVTLHCLAYPDDTYSTSRDEIEMWKSMACETINNTPLDNGTDLQANPSNIFTITEGNESWNGALYPISFSEDDLSDDIIEYDLIFELQLTNNPTSAVYSPDYRLYKNVDYQCWTANNPEIVTSNLPLTVGTVGSVSGSFGWNSPGEIKIADGVMASATNNSNTIQQSDWIQGSNFEFDIPTDHVVTRVHIRCRYANNSELNSSFNSPYHYLRISGASFPEQVIKQNFLRGNSVQNPSNIQDFILDTIPGAKPQNIADAYNINEYTLLPTFSTDPAAYNDSTFMVEYSSNCGPYKTVWCDYIQVTVFYQPAGLDLGADPNAEGYEIGIMTITEQQEVKEVQIEGNACNLPATLTVNGVTLPWAFSHDHNTGDIGTNGTQKLVFTVTPPSTIITLTSSTHEPPVDGEDSAAINSGSRPNTITNIFA
jgi:hypothetical protein